jgi:hypothetical protein
MKNVFISYRRSDSQDATRRIHDWLALHFPQQGLFFLDIDSIRAAADFPEELETAIATSALMLAIIGGKWTSELRDRSASGKTDHVRMEIEAAYQKRVVILPILLDETAVPDREGLPQTLQFLTTIEVRRVHSDNNFETDMQRLAKVITHITNERHSDFTLLLRNARKAGLTWFDMTFSTYAQEALVEEASELTLVYNDGRNWLDMRGNLLTRWFSQTGKSLRFTCLHPDSPFLETLVKKNTKPLATQRYEILRGLLRIYKAASDGGNPAALQMFGHLAFNPITLLMNEKRAFLSHYLYTEQTELLAFEYQNLDSSSYYHVIRRDVEALLTDTRLSRPITEIEIEHYREEIARHQKGEHLVS